jgi:BolA protein
MSVTETIRAKLLSRFQPLHLDILDESHRHRGHAGAREGGESHFQVHIVAAEFTGLTRIQRQRLVYEALADELAGPVHALAVKAEAPKDRS